MSYVRARSVFAGTLLAAFAAGSAHAGACVPVETGTNVEDAGALTVGQGADGTYLLGAGCDEQWSGIRVGVGGVGELVVEESGALATDVALNVGYTTEGRADFRDGAEVAVGEDCEVSGFFTGAAISPPLSTLIVRDEGTSLSCADTLVVGVKGPGLLDLRDGATLTTLFLSSGHDGTADIEVTNGALLEVTGVANHILGVREAGSLLVDDAAVVFAPRSYLFTASVELEPVDLRIANDGLLSVGGLRTGPRTDVVLDAGVLETTAAGLTVCEATCSLTGDGVVRGLVQALGEVAPGPAPGEIGAISIEEHPGESRTGWLIVSDTADLAFDVAGPQQYDRIDVETSLRFYGPRVVVDFVGGFAPTSGRFELLTSEGAVDAYEVPELVVTGLPEQTPVALALEGGAMVLTVPEPLGATPALCALGSLVWLRRGRGARGCAERG